MPDRLLLFVLDEKGLSGDPIQIPMSRQDLARAALNVSLFIETRGNLGYDEVQKLFDEYFTAHNLHYFYHMLIEPAMSRISDKKTIYIIPHGHLLGLPFHAMLQPDDTTLVDRFAIAYAPGLSVLKICHDKGKDNRDSCYSAGVSAAKGGPELAADIARDVARIFGYSPMPATRDAILSQAGEYDVINIACHSDLNNPYTSFKGLALEDGILTQNDIRRMDCSSSLVMLTSCDTAHSDVLTEPGKEMGGLIGAFMCAGCPSVVASLYPVPARIVLPMMEAFCRALKSKGVSRAEALRIAQMKMEKERPADNPYYWASFSLWGDT
jgi:CHAT domain-containing protein